MINLLFASSDEFGLSQIAALYAEDNLKGKGYKVFAINTGDINEYCTDLINALENEARAVPRIKQKHEIPFKAIDLLFSIVSESISEVSLFLQGYPTRIKLKIREEAIVKLRAKEENSISPLLTELKKTIDGLCEENYLSALVDAAETTHFILDSFAEGIIAHDMERRITYFNKAAEDLTGYSRHEVIGRDCHDVFPGKFCGLKCAFCDGCPVFNTVKYNTEIFTKFGLKKNIEMSVTGIKGNQKELIGVLASFRDRTKEADLETRLQRTHSFAGIIGKDPKMLEVFELIRSVADSKAPVLVYGASGTGKELVASAIHNESNRRDKRFVTVNCGAIPETLLESELFGHTKGAFTGAIRDKKGRFELADGGTIFLDEIGDISHAMQVKLLRVLQEGTFEKVGGEDTIKVNVRVISATNKDLKYEIERGKFREDLFYRLSVVPVNLPSLSERSGDIPLIAKELLKRVLESEERADNITLSKEALSVLVDYEWPGNIRELQNWLQFAIIKVPKDGIIKPEHFPHYLNKKNISHDSEELLKIDDKRKKLNEASVREALVKAKGNKKNAAKILGVGRATLYRFLDSLKS